MSWLILLAVVGVLLTIGFIFLFIVKLGIILFLICLGLLGLICLGLLLLLG